MFFLQYSPANHAASRLIYSYCCPQTLVPLTNHIKYMSQSYLFTYVQSSEMYRQKNTTSALIIRQSHLHIIISSPLTALLLTNLFLTEYQNPKPQLRSKWGHFFHLLSHCAFYQNDKIKILCIFIYTGV